MFFVPKFISHLKFSFSLITINTYANNYREKQDIGGWPKTEQIIHVQCRYVCLVKQLKMVYIDHFQPVTTASIVQFHQSSAQDSTFFLSFWQSYIHSTERAGLYPAYHYQHQSHQTSLHLFVELHFVKSSL